MSDPHGHGHAHDHDHDDHGHAHDHGHGHGHGHDHGVEPEHEDHGHAEPEVLVDAPLGQARKFYEVGDVRFCAIDEGSGPVILFLHGFPTSSALWRHVIADLAPRGFRCIAPDLLGFGDTECPVDADFGLAHQAELVLDMLAAAGATGELALVGHGWGGVIGQLLAATAPERLSRLVLLDTPAFGAQPPRVSNRLRAGARFSVVWDFLCDSGFLRWFAASKHGMRAGTYDPTALAGEAITEYIRPLYRDTPPAYRAGRERFRRAMLQIEPELADLQDSVVQALKRFEKPTLVVWGCDDPYISVSWGKKLSDEIPGCVGFELIPFCGHWIPEEKPKVLADLIGAHLSAPPSAPVSAEVAAPATAL